MASLVGGVISLPRPKIGLHGLNLSNFWDVNMHTVETPQDCTFSAIRSMHIECYTSHYSLLITLIHAVLWITQIKFCVGAHIWFIWARLLSPIFPIPILSPLGCVQWQTKQKKNKEERKKNQTDGRTDGRRDGQREARKTAFVKCKILFWLLTSCFSQQMMACSKDGAMNWRLQLRWTIWIIAIITMCKTVCKYCHVMQLFLWAFGIIKSFHHHCH